MKEDNFKHIPPDSNIDLTLRTTDTVWGRSEVSPELMHRLKKDYLEKDKDNNDIIVERSMWGLLGFYTRDVRLANLSEWNGELKYCRYYLDLANDFLQVGQYKPFLICLSRAASVLETSQSKGGFFRRILNTFIEEKVGKDQEAPKKSLFGGQKKQYEG